MKLHELSSITKKTKRRLGQGHGSGRGKTGGRGTKGQKAKGKISLSFEGGALPLIKRLPFMRGKNRNKGKMIDKTVIPVSILSSLPKNSEVTIALLIKAGLIEEKEAKKDGVKIVGGGELSVPLQVKLPVTASAKAIIEKAGGTVA